MTTKHLVVISYYFLPQDDHRPASGCGVALCNRLTLDESTGVSGSTISLIRTTDGGAMRGLFGAAEVHHFNALAVPTFDTSERGNRKVHLTMHAATR